MIDEEQPFSNIMRKGEDLVARQRLIIHLGYPKTGSSTIQDMLLTNSDRLGFGIRVSTRDSLTRSLRKYAIRYSRNGHPYWQWQRDRALRRLKRAIEDLDFKTLIISDENIIGLKSGDLFRASPKQLFMDSARMLVSALSAYDVTYVIYLREVESWQLSTYNQAFKMRRTRQSFEDWRAAHNWIEGPTEITADLRSILGDKLTVLWMEDEVDRGKLLGSTLLTLAGVSDEIIAKIKPPQRKNESIPVGAIEFLRLVHSNPYLRGKRYKLISRIVSENPVYFSREVENQPKRPQD